MLAGHRITFPGSHPINKNMLAGRRFTLRGPRVADPWYKPVFPKLCKEIILLCTELFNVKRKWI